LEMVDDGTMNRKSHVAYRIAQLPVTLNDSEGHFCDLKRV